ncbi:hypothetical protein M0638_27020 [Roseomonas sp. NAR14]|uniref:Uncharacterized protein n=1 Tax=Roseomonas acroporae TaxID=2937791 RepID=A0A9X1YD89_9PROT|nr:hypothetical protein [Roseomonas acroporae]MCK8788013.1 hypothetical protein [Roseomonas acroporae]
MTIMDALNTFDNAMALTVSRASTDTMDLGVSRDIGITETPLLLLFQFTTLPTAAGAATVQVDLQTSPDNSTWTTIQSSGPVAYTAFTARDPAGGIRMAVTGPTQRYVRCNYTIAAGPLTAGAVTASLVRDRDMQRFYNRNYAV